MKATDFLPKTAGKDTLEFISRLTAEFYSLAALIEEKVPASANRTAAMRKMLEAKMTLVQGITHPDA